SASRWNQLSPEEQTIIMESAEAAKEFQKDLWKKDNEEQIQKMEEEGVTFTRLENKDAFIEATKAIYEEFEGTEVLNYAERIRSVK
ncbi:MAG: hypothetical protein ACP5I1_07750, partial [Candidatus Hinthialibacter sp.]